jgi:hypothetical protein
VSDACEWKVKHLLLTRKKIADTLLVATGTVKVEDDWHSLTAALTNHETNRDHVTGNEEKKKNERNNEVYIINR